MKLPRRLALLLGLLPQAACCSLARLFCGPDKTPWVSVSYDEPRLALATFLEALRRDDALVVYRSLSRGFCARNHLDAPTLGVVWDRLHEQIPYLHLAGYLPVPDKPVRETARRVTYELDVDG